MGLCWPIVGQAFLVGAIDIEDFDALRRAQQKLFPHFRQARTAILLIQKIKNGGHDSVPVV